MNPVEKRVSERVHVEIPVYLGQEELVTRDVSLAGIYFLSEDLFAEGKILSFSLAFDYTLSGNLLKFSCLGEVVRVEPQDRKFGIAAKIKDLKFIH